MEMEPHPPPLTPEEEQLLNFIANAWRAAGNWPRRERVFLEYRKRGQNLEALLDTLPDAFCRLNQLTRDERIELTIAGLEQCERGDREVRPFLELVRRVVARFIADQTVPAQVTGEDFAQLLGPERNDEMRRLREFYARAWEGGRSASSRSEWFLQAGIEDVRLARVATGWEYLQLRRARPRVLEKLEDIHHYLLKVVYAAWHETKAWPRAVDVVVREWQHGDILTHLAEIPHRYLCEMMPSSPGLDQCRLTLPGVALVAPQAEPVTYIRILQAILQRYVDTNGEEPASATEIARSLGILEQDVRRVGEFLQQERFSGVRIEDTGLEWLAKADSMILRWEGVHSYEEYAAVCDRLESEERKELDDLTTLALEAQSVEQLGGIAGGPPPPADWDVFICHASEDKRAVVAPLARGLRDRGFHVWYDEWTLQVGDSLRRKIDEGLARSQFAIVVLSASFFKKKWPQHELDGLVQRETASKRIILPVWHGVGHDEVARYSLPLADRVAGSTGQGIQRLVEQLAGVLRSSDEDPSSVPGAELRVPRRRVRRIASVAATGGILALVAVGVARRDRLPWGTMQIHWGTTPYDHPTAIAERFRQPFAVLHDQFPRARFTLGEPLADYQALYQALADGDVEIAGISPYTYVEKRLEIEQATGLLEVFGRTNGNPTRSSVLAVRNESPLHSLADLRGYAGITFLFGQQPWSTSRSVVPKLILSEAGVALIPGRYDYVSEAERESLVLGDSSGLTVGAFYSDDLGPSMRIVAGSEFPMPTEVVVLNRKRLEHLFGARGLRQWLSQLRARMERMNFVYPMDTAAARRHVRPLESLVYSPVLREPIDDHGTWKAVLLVSDDRWSVGWVGHHIPYLIYRRGTLQPADVKWPEVKWEFVGSAYVQSASGREFTVRVTEGQPMAGDHLFLKETAPDAPDSVYVTVPRSAAAIRGALRPP